MLSSSVQAVGWQRPLQWLAALLLWACLGVFSRANAEEPVAVSVLHQARVLISDATTLPGADAPWQAVELPHRALKPGGGALVGYWYQASFMAPAPTGPSIEPVPALWLYLPRLPSGGAIFVNGAQIADVPNSNPTTQVRWYRPHLMMIPPVVLRPGVNSVAVRLAIREPRASFGEIEIGPEAPLRQAYDRLFFWEHTVAETSSAICLLVGTLILLFWARRPQEKLYALFGMCVLFWGLRTLLLLTPIVPMQMLVAWRSAYYFTTAGFIVLITIFMLKFCGAIPARFAQILTIYWLAGCLLFIVVGMPARPFLNSWWLPGFMPCAIFAVFRLSAFALRRPTWSSLAMGLAVAFALTLSIHDLAVQEAWFPIRELYLMHLAIPSFLLVMASVLSDRFLESLEKVESVNTDLAQRVAFREREIEASYGRVRLLEQANAATEERQRIMQDMHDGVGSQLVTALMMVERSATTREDTVTLLQECIDDMRLVIESLSPGVPDLLPVLGNFRFRMASRFKAMGLTLNWRNQNMPDSLVVPPHVGLHIMRVLQEALANVLKHAGATSVAVELDFAGDALRIDISDDGRGYEVTSAGAGRGLHNMAARARKLGATFQVERLAQGTAVRLAIPLAACLAPLTPDGVPLQSQSSPAMIQAMPGKVALAA